MLVDVDDGDDDGDDANDADGIFFKYCFPITSNRHYPESFPMVCSISTLTSSTIISLNKTKQNKKNKNCPQGQFLFNIFYFQFFPY